MCNMKTREKTSSSTRTSAKFGMAMATSPHPITSNDRCRACRGASWSTAKAQVRSPSQTHSPPPAGATKL